MTTYRLSVGLLLTLLFLGFGVQAADEKGAAGAKIQVQLIWGSDEEKPQDPKIKEVGPKFAEKLCKVFKWKKYYEVKNVDVVIPAAQAKKLKLSDKCEVEIKDIGKGMMEAKLFGQGNLVKTVKHPITPGECLVMAGDDKDNTAWFVVLTVLPSH